MIVFVISGLKLVMALIMLVYEHSDVMTRMLHVFLGYIESDTG